MACDFAILVSPRGSTSPFGRLHCPGSFARDRYQSRTRRWATADGTAGLLRDNYSCDLTSHPWNDTLFKQTDDLFSDNRIHIHLRRSFLRPLPLLWQGSLVR